MANSLSNLTDRLTFLCKVNRLRLLGCFWLFVENYTRVLQFTLCYVSLLKSGLWRNGKVVNVINTLNMAQQDFFAIFGFLTCLFVANGVLAVLFICRVETSNP